MRRGLKTKYTDHGSIDGIKHSFSWRRPNAVVNGLELCDTEDLKPNPRTFDLEFKHHRARRTTHEGICHRNLVINNRLFVATSP